MGSMIAKVFTILVFGGGGLVMLYIGATQFFLQRRLLTTSATVPATIVLSEVKRLETRDSKHGDLRDDSTVSYRAEVKFKYTLDGREYESDMLRPTIIGRDFGSESAALEETAPFPLGATVSAFYHPAHPDKAFLIKESGAGPTVFIIVGALLPVAALAVSKWVL